MMVYAGVGLVETQVSLSGEQSVLGGQFSVAHSPAPAL